MKTVAPSVRRGLALALSAALLGGCASARNPDDPFESYNRGMYAFNEQADRAVFKPLAEVYDAVVPAPARTAVGNVFGNLGDPWIGVNNALQGKVGDALSDMMRFMVNSTFGIFGLLDIATPMGLPKHDEDLGQTLGSWGVGEGAYFMLPILGPRTVRDTVALPVDLAANSVFQVDDIATRNTLRVLDITHTRWRLLGADQSLKEAALDKYAYLRDFYLEQRRYKVSDGNTVRIYEDFDSDPAPAVPTR
jgi:phospholipid-binding lipoprotein MlaA